MPIRFTKPDLPLRPAQHGVEVDKHGDINILAGQERNQLLVEFNATQADFPKEKSIVDLFMEQVLWAPEALAIVFEDQELSYSEVNTRSNQLANYLTRSGIKAETLVPICVERGPELIVGILGILKAGCAYVPIDPECPAERIRYILEDTNAKLALCGGFAIAKGFLSVKVIDMKGESDLINIESQSSPGIKVLPEYLAYVIYTSGSTGSPKGVMVEHKSLVNYIYHCKSSYINVETENAATFIHLSFSFDASLIGLFAPLLSGKFLVIGSKQSLDVFKDRNLEKYAPYDFIAITPSHLTMLPATFKSAGGGWLTDKLVIGGEALRISQLDCLIKAGINVQIINEYGPTEATVGCCTYRFYTLGEHEFTQNNVPIGKPISNTQIYILTADNELSPIGVAGQIYIGGVAVARGYLNRAELTAEKFIKDPFNTEPNTRLYKTGDLARRLPNGNIEYLGRIDDQVKIRGYRIELGEIESILNRSPLIRQGVVIAKEDGNGSMRLIGYVVPSGEFNKQMIHQYLASKLPEYMVPTIWVALESVPLTENGKIDRNNFPDPELKDMAAPYEAPRNQTEQVLTEMWQEMLGLKRVGIHDNFFELGGHSLLAIRLISAIRRELNIELNFSDLFVHPSIDKLIAQAEFKNKATSPILIPLRATGKKIPLYIICGAGGTVFNFMDLVKMLDSEQPVFGLQQPLDDDGMAGFPDTIEGIAEIYLREIIKQNPDGPYALSGHCIGGNIAFEMALQLKKMGKAVALVVLFDPYQTKEEETMPASPGNFYRIPDFLKKALSKIILKIEFELFLLLKHPKQNLQYRVEKMRSIMGINENRRSEIELQPFNKVSKILATAIKRYKMIYYEGEIIVFYATEHYYFNDWNKRILYKRIDISDDTKNTWKRYADIVKMHEIEGAHSAMFDLKHAEELAETLQGYLDNVS